MKCFGDKYILRNIESPRQMGICWKVKWTNTLGMTANLEYPSIAITPRSILTRIVKVPLMG